LQSGGGIEFAEHREYAPGDDLRYLDWNLYARHDELLLKRFQEEEDLHVYVFVDCSQSMDFGQPNKFDQARRVAAALAYIALADLDRVSVIAFASNVFDVFPLTRGKERILPLLKYLSQLRCRRERTDLARTLTSFVHAGQRPGLAIVVSDLYDQAGFQRGLDLLRHRKFEPHLVQLYDRCEADPKLLGDMQLEDAETGESRKVTVNERSLRRYRRVFLAFLQSIEDYSRKYGLGCTRASTEVPFDQLIMRMMRVAGALR
jgi:uncharacterized protein (DUF58 family)